MIKEHAECYICFTSSADVTMCFSPQTAPTKARQERIHRKAISDCVGPERLGAFIHPEGDVIGQEDGTPYQIQWEFGQVVLTETFPAQEAERRGRELEVSPSAAPLHYPHARCHVHQEVTHKSAINKSSL